MLIRAHSAAILRVCGVLLSLPAFAVAFEGTKPADPVLAAKVSTAQKQADEAFAKQQTAEKSLLATQGKLKLASQAVAKAKAQQSKASADVAANQKSVTDKALLATKSRDALKPLESQLQQAQGAVRKSLEQKAQSEKPLQEAQSALQAAQALLQAAQAAASKGGNDPAFEVVRAAAEQVVAQKQAALRMLQSRFTTAAQPSGEAVAALKALEEKAAPLFKAAKEAEDARQAAEQKLEAAQAQLAPATAAVKQAEANYQQVKGSVDRALADLAIAQEHATKTLKIAEEALAATGQLVLFSKHMAPLFMKRCVACHNAQVAKGRYNMDTYAGVMKGGEQGDTVIPKDAELSNLVEVVENGSMPKDADPLTQQEISLIKQWILNGARLDAGLKPEQPLTAIAPKEPQPLPPKVYRVPVPITAVAFSPDGNLVAAAGYHEVVLWSPLKGTEVRRISNVAERTYGLEFSADGKLLAVAAGTPGQMGEVKLFNPSTGDLIRDLQTSNDAVFGVAFSPDGKRLATCSADRSIRIFNLQTFAQETLIEDHADWVMSVAWSPDGKKVVSASRDKTSKLFDSKTGESLITFAGHGDVVYSAVFAPDGKQVLSCGRDNKTRVWNPENGKLIRDIGGYGGEVYRVVCTPEGRVFSCSTDKLVREHKLSDGSQVRAFTGHSDWVYSLAVHPATKRLASGSWDGEIRVWDMGDAKNLQHFVAAPGYATPAATASVK